VARIAKPQLAANRESRNLGKGAQKAEAFLPDWYSMRAADG
jgi:hypothetical protein